MRREFYLGLSALPLLVAAIMPGESKDPIALLQSELASGKTKLAYEPKYGYLKALLARLQIDPNSQTLVFSKTSLQSDFITPKTPRAIYFNADTYVGWIPGAPLIEIATVDPNRGVVFYTLANEKPSAMKLAAQALQAEPNRCIRCHGGVAPRLFANSVFTAPSGYPRVFAPAYRVTPDLPLRLRWGGWYVTGQHGGQRHMGNELALGNDEKYRIDTEKGANVKSLRRYLDPSGYLTPYSDIVALMTMEAQMEVQNVLSETQNTLREEPVADACEPLVEALLNCGEARLTSPIKGVAGFSQPAPKDQKGRSLADLDLQTRLQKYPCSPLVYSRSFDCLPVTAKNQIWRRFKEILTGKTASPRFSHLSSSDRQAIFEILRETKPDFAQTVGQS